MCVLSLPSALTGNARRPEAMVDDKNMIHHQEQRAARKVFTDRNRRRKMSWISTFRHGMYSGYDFEVRAVTCQFELGAKTRLDHNFSAHPLSTSTSLLIVTSQVSVGWCIGPLRE